MPKYNRATQIEQKTSNGFDANNIKYLPNCPSLLGSSKNAGPANLEEELLIGRNYITFQWEETHDFYGKLTRIQKEYRLKSQTDDFYYTLTTTANGGVIATDGSFFANDGKLFVPIDNGDDTGTADDNNITAAVLELKNGDLGEYTYTVNSAGTVIIKTTNDELKQFVQQTTLWYRPSGVSSSDEDKLIEMAVITPYYQLEDEKITQIKEIQNCWLATINDYPTRTEAETTWQIL